jgi:peptide deformylase
VVVRAFDEEMKEFELEGEGLLARAIMHENDHLDGHLYVEKAEGPVRDVKATQE